MRPLMKIYPGYFHVGMRQIEKTIFFFPKKILIIHKKNFKIFLAPQKVVMKAEQVFT